MTDSETRPPEYPPWRPPRRRSPRRVVLGVAAGLVVATGAGVAAAAGSPAHQSPPQQVQPSPEATGTAGGGVRTFTSQTGTATSVQRNSITVQGEDGGSRTYTVDDTTRVVAGAGGLTGISTGDQVWVVAQARNGERATAYFVVDLTRPRWQAPTPTATESPSPGGSPPAESSPSRSPSPETVPPTE